MAVKRVANDAQIDRLFARLKRSDNKPGLSEYGKQLAKKIAVRDKIKTASAERRLQRYITTAGERRSVYKAPVKYVREVRAIVRRTPPPKPKKIEPQIFADETRIREESKRESKRRIPEPIIERRPARELLPRYEPSTTSLYELRAIIAYFDGDTTEAGRALRVDSRLLDLASQGTSVTRAQGAGRIDEGVEKLYATLDQDDINDIEDFAALLHDLPDWRIGLILDDMAEGNTTFSDWIDAWHDDDMDIDSDDSEFWALWRQAYKAATGK